MLRVGFVFTVLLALVGLALRGPVRAGRRRASVLIVVGTAGFGIARTRPNCKSMCPESVLIGKRRGKGFLTELMSLRK
jgi:hypothetical protein